MPHRSDQASPPARLVLILPGAASLGAYEAGAVAGIIEGTAAMSAAGRSISIPALGGASAGATIAMLGARILTAGLDAVSLLQRAWVEEVDLELLTAGKAGPLGLEDLRTAMASMLERANEYVLPDRRLADVGLHVALTSLRGFEYRLDDLGSHTTSAVTYADWAQWNLRSGADLSAFTEGTPSLLDVVVSSTANPAVFPPTSVAIGDRADHYARRSLVDPPDAEERWWFTDGGLVQSEPIQRTLDLVAPAGGRVHCLVIDPRSEAPSTGGAWADGDQEADWLAGLMRAMSIFPVQVLSDELRRLSEVNRIRRSLAELAELLEPADESSLAEWLDHHEHVDADHDRVLTALLTAAGISRRVDVHADVISPSMVAGGASIDRLLAGEVLGDFAGFLSADLRRSDFSLGYAAAREWWLRARVDLEVDDDVMDEVLQHLDDKGPPPWEEVDVGDADLSDVSLRSRAALARVAFRAIRGVASRDS